MTEPAALVARHLGRLRQARAIGPLVDLACGRGRNALALTAAGLDCIGIDRNEGFLREWLAAAREHPARAQAVRCDLETGGGIPLRAASCGAVLVFRFLSRPLAPAIEHVLAPGGLLLYETFTHEQPRHGWGPSRADFLLGTGELPSLFPGLEVLEHDESPTHEPRPESAARLVARKPAR